MSNLGFVGLGVMGGRVAKRLMDAGYTVVGHDLYKEKAEQLMKAGMRWANTPREATEKSDIIFSMVTNTAAVQAITSGPNGIIAGLRSGQIYVDHSTITPAVSRQIAAQVAAKGAYMLDATVSGSAITVEQGKLSIMVGGDRKAFEKVKPILEAEGPKVTYVGGNGLALSMKIAINLQLGVQMVAFAEGMLLAEKSGIPREAALEAMLNSVAASPMLLYRAPFVLKEPQEIWFNVNMMQKDMLLALEMGRELHVPLPSTAVSNEVYTAAKGMGMEEKEMAEVYDALAQMSGVQR